MSNKTYLLAIIGVFIIFILTSFLINNLPQLLNKKDCGLYAIHQEFFFKDCECEGNKYIKEIEMPTRGTPAMKDRPIICEGKILKTFYRFQNIFETSSSLRQTMITNLNEAISACAEYRTHSTNMVGTRCEDEARILFPE